MFGTIPLAADGVTTKVHFVSGGKKIMITKLFRHTVAHRAAAAVPSMTAPASSVSAKAAAGQGAPVPVTKSSGELPVSRPGQVPEGKGWRREAAVDGGRKRSVSSGPLPSEFVRI